ncbi:MAG TPA: type II secretion system minor pseudopilin GspI [Steroidobacteraceae bacterium]|nr:type II secretion system minor pseudopilin GspI [Steroidobacteraceae bacterium]
MRDGARGFTLIEVLVALAIVAIGMAAVLGSLSSSADTVSRLRDKTFAQWFAMNRIATLRLSGQAPPTGKSNGDDDYAGRKWHWAQEVVTTEVPGVERIDVNVRPADIKVENDDSGWLTTVSGIWGDAVGIPNGYQPDWGAQLPRGAPGGGQIGTLGTPGAPAPGQPFTPNISPQPAAPTQPPPLTNPNQNQ